MSAPYFNQVLVDNHDRWGGYAAGSTSLKQFQFVLANSSGELVNPSAGGPVAGILDDSGSAATATLDSNGEYTGGFTVGEFYGIVFQGVMKVYAGGTVAVGDEIATDASGNAVAATTGDQVVARSMGAGASGDLISVLLYTAQYTK